MTREEKRQRAIELRAAGWSLRRIAGELGCSASTIHDWTENGTVSPSARRDRAPGARLSARKPPSARQNTPPQSAPEGAHQSARAERSARIERSEAEIERSRPVEKITHLLTGLKRSGSEWAARCPAHDDRRQSLTVREGDDGRVLLHCHAGCTPHEIVSALGLRLGDLFPPKQRSSRRIVATYDYRDAAGELLFQVVRFEPKDFRQRRPDGRGGWTWKLGDTPRVPYRLPELLAADPDQWVFVVEGEKDADRLAVLGLVATCNPGGAGKWSRLSDDSVLHGRCVAIIADKDAPGRAHARDVAMRLHNRSREVRIIELPGDGKDVSDWLDAGGTADELRLVCAGVPVLLALDTPHRAKPGVAARAVARRAMRRVKGWSARPAAARRTWPARWPGRWTCPCSRWPWPSWRSSGWW